MPRSLALAAAAGLSLSAHASAWAECAVQEFRCAGASAALGRRMPDRRLAGVRGPPGLLREKVRALDLAYSSLEPAGAKPAAAQRMCNADRVWRKQGRPPKLTRSTESESWPDGWGSPGRAFAGVH